MADTKDSKICPKCQMPYDKAGSGSLTQWILVCSCHLKEQQSDNASADPLNICSNCGKRIELGRAGTLTQWIFRADLCSCAMPSFVGSGEFGSVQPAITAAAKVDELDSMAEMTIESGSFPIDRYAPFRLLGKGAAGSVYLCKDRLLKKRVAVKVLHDLSPELLIAFQREAKSTSQLTHSNIVKVLDFGVAGGQSPYMVLDFINGVNLEQLLTSDGPLRLEDALPVFEQLCEALRYAHGRGLMHRDLKPSNVIIVPATEMSPAAVHLIDFGVGAFKQELLDPRDSQSNTVVGTPAYMSPDQAAGIPYDARSEIYSLGCVMFETLTGSVPFVADTPLIAISLHAHQPPPLLSDALDSREFPDHIEEIVATCLKKAPEERFQSVDELKKAISELRASLQERHNKTPAGTNPTQKTSSIPIFAALGLILVTATIAFIYYQFSPISESAAPINNSVSRDLDDGYESLVKSKFHRLGKDGWSTGTEITDEDFKEIADEPNTRTITINVTYTVTGTGFNYVKDLPIRRINIQSTALTDQGLEAISKIKTLNWLSINVATSFTANGINYLRQLPKLDKLEFLLCVMPKGAFDAISQMHQLTGISLYDSKMITPSDIGKLVRGNPKLTYLDLTSTGLTDEGVSLAGEFKELKQLRAVRLPITDKCMESLAKSVSLLDVWLSETLISDRGLLALAKSRTLRRIQVANCRNLTTKGILAFKKARPDIKLDYDSDDVSDERYKNEHPMPLAD